MSSYKSQTIEDILNEINDSFYERYKKEIEKYIENNDVKLYIPGIKKSWCVAALLQYILSNKENENDRMLIPPHKLQTDFKLYPDNTIKYVNSRISDFQKRMGLKQNKNIDKVLCYINFAEKYNSNYDSEIFNKARDNYTKNKEKLNKVYNNISYKIAISCLLDAGLDSSLIEKTFCVNKYFIEAVELKK
jgi:hypothetical protein